jgi:translation initiation factor 4A
MTDNKIELTNPDKEYSNWDDFDLSPDLLRSIYAYGFEQPSSIQKKAIPALLTKRDVIAQAQSGTGKTGSFSVGTLQQIDISLQATQVLVIVPTHELAHQVEQVFRNLSTFMEGLRIQTLLGGTSVSTDMNNLKGNVPHIVIGCTGRIFDMIKRKALNLGQLKVFVLDEADEMLSHGFKDHIYNIFQYLPKNMQVALFSATMPDYVLDLTKKFMIDPIQIIMRPEELTLEGINQYYLAMYDDHNKFDQLKILFKEMNISQTIIYANSVGRVIDLYNAMKEEGYSVCCIHSSMTKEERKTIIDKFRNSTYRILISSNLTARGIDIQQVNVVINFDIPKSAETYLHRIGRSGRWGRKGTAINFVTKKDVFSMKNIERVYKIDIPELPTNFCFN